MSCKAGLSAVSIAKAVGLDYNVVRNVLIDPGIDTSDRRHLNRPGVPRTCTKCGRTEEEGARFTPGEQANRCADCLAAWQRAYQRKKHVEAAEKRRQLEGAQSRATP